MKRKVLIILLLIVGLFIFTGCGEKDPSKKIMDVLEDKGYTFDVIYYATGTTKYFLSKDNVSITRESNSNGENEYYYSDSKVNDEYANIYDKDFNESDEEKAQYESYEDWLVKNKLDKDKIIDLFEYYEKSLKK